MAIERFRTDVVEGENHYDYYLNTATRAVSRAPHRETNTDGALPEGASTIYTPPTGPVPAGEITEIPGDVGNGVEGTYRMRLASLETLGGAGRRRGSAAWERVESNLAVGGRHIDYYLNRSTREVVGVVHSDSNPERMATLPTTGITGRYIVPNPIPADIPDSTIPPSVETAVRERLSRPSGGDGGSGHGTGTRSGGTRGVSGGPTTYERIGSEGGFVYYQIRTGSTYGREVVRVAEREGLRASETSRPSGASPVEGLPTTGDLPSTDLVLPGTPTSGIEHNYRQNLRGGGGAAALGVPYPPSASGGPTGAATNPHEELLLRGLTGVFGGGAEGERLARAYMDNPPTSMTRDQWIENQYGSFYENGVLRTGTSAPPLPTVEQLQTRLARNLENQVIHLYETAGGVGSSHDTAVRAARSFRVEDDPSATITNLMAERDRLTAIGDARARATRSVASGGLGWSEDRWHEWARDRGYETSAGLPSPTLDATSLNTDLDNMAAIERDETRLRGYLTQRYGEGSTPDLASAAADRYMSGAPAYDPEHPERRRDWVRERLGRFETDATHPRPATEWPTTAVLNGEITTDSVSRAREALREFHGTPGHPVAADDPRVIEDLRAAGLDPAHPPTDPAAASTAAQRIVAINEARNRYIRSGHTAEQFNDMASRRGWLNGERRISTTASVDSIEGGSDVAQAVEDLRARLASEGYPPDQVEFIIANLRTPPGDPAGTSIANASSAEVVRRMESAFFSQPREERDRAMLTLAQMNLVRDYANKMHISEEAARVYLAATGGAVRRSATWDQVWNEQQRVDRLTSGTDEFRGEAAAVRERTGAHPGDREGNRTRIDALRRTIDPADLQYQDQLAQLDASTRRQATLEGIRHNNSMDLERLKQDHAMAQLERRAELDQELEGIRHRNAMEVEDMRQHYETARSMINMASQFISSLLTAYSQAVAADKQMLGQIVTGSINRMQAA